MKDLIGHVQNFGLYSEGNAVFVKGFQMVSDKPVE